MLFKSPLGCIHRSVRELCTTPNKRIKPQFCAGFAVRVEVNSLDEESPCCCNLLALCNVPNRSTSYAALWLLYQRNLSSGVARWPLCQTISKLLPGSQEQMR